MSERNVAILYARCPTCRQSTGYCSIQLANHAKTLSADCVDLLHL